MTYPMTTIPALPYRMMLVSMIVFMSSISTTVSAQVVLYLELMKEEKPIKYYEGQMLSYKSAEYPGEWNEVVIERIMDAEQIILFDGGMLKLSDITDVRRTRPWARTVGLMMQTFGVAWLGFGGLAHFTTSTFDFGVDTAVIGGTSIIAGYTIRKLFKYKKYKIGNKHRLKILDLSWPEPRG